MVKLNDDDDQKFDYNQDHNADTAPLPKGRDWFYVKILTGEVHGKTLIEFVCRNPRTVHGMMFTLCRTAYEMKKRTGSCELEILMSSTRQANVVMKHIAGKSMHETMGIKDDADCIALISEIFEFFVQGKIMSPERDADDKIIGPGTMIFYCDEEEAVKRIDSLFQKSVI